jgi:hypothetical protein
MIKGGTSTGLPLLPREKGEEIIALIEHLEELETINEIVELVAITN